MLVRPLATILRNLFGPPRDPLPYQLSCLRRLIAHTWRYNSRISSWWREAGLEPAPLASLDGLSRYPITRKSQYQALAPQDLVSDDFRGAALKKTVTSGSTAIPLAIYRTRLEDLVLCSLRVRTYFGYGLGWLDRRAVLRTGLDAAFGGRSDRAAEPWMKLGLLRQDYVSHVELEPPEVFRRLRELRPDVIGGHADGIYRLALELPGSDLRSLGLKYLTAGVQTVTPEMRERISRAFGRPLYVTYGASEFNMLAAQCPQTGLFHLNEEGAYVEVLREGKPARDGEEGEVFVTNLHAYAIPYVRYALDDWATMGPSRCPCGAPVRTLREIQGRIAEFFHFSDGRRVHPFQLINPLLEFIGWLREYRMVQSSRDEVEVWYTVLPGAPPPEMASAAIERAVGSAAGPAVRIRAVPMDSLPPTSKGKNRMFAALPPQR